MADYMLLIAEDDPGGGAPICRKYRSSERGNMIREELDNFTNIKDPKKEDYFRLLQFTKNLARLFFNERKAKSKINKKRNRLANQYR